MSICIQLGLQRRSTLALRNTAPYHERNASRGPTCPAELLWRATHHLVGFLRIHHLVNSACTATRYPAVRAGFSSRDGSEPDRRLAAETPHTTLHGCHHGD